MDFSQVSSSKLREISQNYQSRINELRKEMEEYILKHSIIEEELNKRLRIDEYSKRMEEESKGKISRILSDVRDETKTKKTERKPKKKEEEEEPKQEPEKKWTIDDMKKLLDKKGVKYQSSLKKADFVKLIRDNNGVREMNSLYKEK